MTEISLKTENYNGTFIINDVYDTLLFLQTFEIVCDEADVLRQLRESIIDKRNGDTVPWDQLKDEVLNGENPIDNDKTNGDGQ